MEENQAVAPKKPKHCSRLKELTPVEAEARRTRLKNLIMLGKERGYLTYAEINDHLPDDMLDAEQIEDVISMINDMGIQVYDEAPDAETLLMSEATPAVADEDEVEEAEQALSTVDSEFGRTTDPVRMYMREMGSVELLTREGEIEIAKRIEDGLQAHDAGDLRLPDHDRRNSAIWPTRSRSDEMRIDELVDGLIEPNAPKRSLTKCCRGRTSSEDDANRRGRRRRRRRRRRSPPPIWCNSRPMRWSASPSSARPTTRCKALSKNGLAQPSLPEGAGRDFRRTDDDIRFSAKQVEACATACAAWSKKCARTSARSWNCAWTRRHAAPHFIKIFPGNESNLDWVDDEIAAAQGL